MNNTKIEWTDTTWNPIRGCSRVSEGCRNCYAEKIAYRFSGFGQPYEGLARITNGHPQWTGKVQIVENHLLDPLKWKKPKRIFVNSMSDLFHENVPDEWLDRIFAVMALCPQHTFQVLTKRPERMLEYFRSFYQRDAEVRGFATCVWVAENVPKPEQDWIERLIIRIPQGLPNVWLGVSVENQRTADERIPPLLQTPAAVRFISAEPLLGPVDLERGGFSLLQPVISSSGVRWPGLNWVIVGGESGLGARPMHPDWVRKLRDQCRAAKVPFFFKQWGKWEYMRDAPNETVWGNEVAIANAYQGDIRGSESLSDETTVLMRKAGKKAAGALLDGREWREFPEVHS
jgi:protein gp37